MNGILISIWIASASAVRTMKRVPIRTVSLSFTTKFFRPYLPGPVASRRGGGPPSCSLRAAANEEQGGPHPVAAKTRALSFFRNCRHR